MLQSYSLARHVTSHINKAVCSPIPLLVTSILALLSLLDPHHLYAPDLAGYHGLLPLADRTPTRHGWRQNPWYDMTRTRREEWEETFADSVSKVIAKIHTQP